MIQRITLMLEKSEMDALRRAARHEMRKPRDHARYLLREILCDSQTTPRIEGSAEVYQSIDATPSQSGPNQTPKPPLRVAGAVSD